MGLNENQREFVNIKGKQGDILNGILTWIEQRGGRPITDAVLKQMEGQVPKIWEYNRAIYAALRNWIEGVHSCPFGDLSALGASLGAICRVCIWVVHSNPLKGHLGSSSKGDFGSFCSEGLVCVACVHCVTAGTHWRGCSFARSRKKRALIFVCGFCVHSK